jgi:hypothetical protein
MFVIATSGSFSSHALQRAGVPVSRILIFIWLSFIISNSTMTSRGEGSDVVKLLAFSR